MAVPLVAGGLIGSESHHELIAGATYIDAPAGCVVLSTAVQSTAFGRVTGDTTVIFQMAGCGRVAADRRLDWHIDLEDGLRALSLI